MEKVNTVSIDLTEYKSFIISQHERGIYKDNVHLEITKAEAELTNLQGLIKDLNAELSALTSKLLELLFKRSQMTNHNDSRSEQTTFGGNYYGFTRSHRDFLIENGYNETMQVKYINSQWDIQDAKDLEKETQRLAAKAEFEAKEEAAKNKKEEF